MTAILARFQKRLQRTASRRLAQRRLVMRNVTPLISFTFDDFPRSALHTAGRILEEHGISGTYYTSLGLMARRSDAGEMFTKDDLLDLLSRGHELGCHTASHCHAAETPPAAFEESILENQRTLRELIPPAPPFRTLSYPIGMPRPETKKRCSRYFAGCRAGGQCFNSGTIDLDLLGAFFIEQSRERPRDIQAMIDRACEAGGWLIFATHDVSDDPTRYGCQTALFADIARQASRSGAQLLPVSAALHALGEIQATSA